MGQVMRSEDVDPKGLIRESYAIAGITAAECRSIFLDWALSLPEGIDQRAALRVLLATYGDVAGHPMTQVLQEGLGDAEPPRRRGGRSGRVGS